MNPSAWHEPLPILLLLAMLLALVVWQLWARRREASRARRRFEQEAARHAAVIESATDAVVSADHEQRIVLFNAGAERLFGCRRDEVLGSSLSRFIPEAYRDRHDGWVEQFGRCAADGPPRVASREVRALRADGSELFVEATLSCTDEPGGDGVRKLFTVVMRDTSARRAAAQELHRISERYRMIVEQSPDAIWLAEGGRLKLVNAACVRLLGAPDAQSLLGRALGEFLPEPDAGRRSEDAVSHELRVRRLDGSTVDVEVSIAQVPDHGGLAVQGMMRDISARKRAQAELQATQDALIQAQRIAKIGHFRLDRRRGLWELSPSVAELLGLPGGSTLSYDEGPDFVHPEDRAGLSRHLEHDVFRQRRNYDHEFRVVRPSDGELRWLHAVGQSEVDANGEVTAVFGTVQDITERKLDELALEHSREELRRLSASVTWAREAERRRVARELHDELGQRLLALKLELSARTGADGGAREAPQPALLAAVDDALAATRRLASDLRPAMLDDLGLAAALEWLADSWGRRTGMTVALDADAVEEGLSEEATITVYRIVQEALTNAARHAQATRVDVRLRIDAGALIVSVEDNGRGLAPGDIDKRDSAGIAGIRERARILGGSARASNAEHGGCRIEARLPVERVTNAVGAREETS